MSDLVWLGEDSSFQVYQLALRKVEAYQLQHGLNAAELLRVTGLNSSSSTEPYDEFNGYGDMIEENGDVAIINIDGSLVSRGWGQIGRYFGIIGYDDIRNALVEVANSGRFKCVLLHVNSGGGSAAGIGELSDFMGDFRKIMKVYGYTGVQALSAGQWLLAEGEKCYAGKMTSVGSIGVISIYMDYSENMKREGIKPVVIRSGSQKALGNGYEPITPEVRAILQERSDRYHGFFKEHMGKRRKVSGAKLDDMCQGQVLFAVDAIEIGLIDEIKSFDDVVIALNARHTSTQSVAPGGHMKRQLNAAGLAAVDAGTISMEAALKDPTLSDEVAEPAAAAAPAAAAPAPAAGAADAPAAAAAAAPADAAALAADAPAAPAAAAAPAAPAAPAAAAPAAGADAGATALLARVETLMTEKLTLSGEKTQLAGQLTEAQTQLQAAQADVAALREIVATSVIGMQTALKLPNTKESLAGLSATDLVKLHANLRADMGKTYPVGGVGTHGDRSNDKGNVAPTGLMAAVEGAAGLSLGNKG